MAEPKALSSDVVKPLDVWKCIFKDFDSKLLSDLQYSSILLAEQRKELAQKQLELEQKQQIIGLQRQSLQLEQQQTQIETQFTQLSNNKQTEICKESEIQHNSNSNAAIANGNSNNSNNGRNNNDGKDSNSNANENVTNDDKKMGDELLTGKNYVRAGFIGSMTADVVHIAESQLGLQQRIAGKNVLVRCVYGVGRSYVTQKIGQSIAKCTENVALGALDRVFDKIPTNQSNIYGYAAQFGGAILYELTKQAAVKCYQMWQAPLQGPNNNGNNDNDNTNDGDDDNNDDDDDDDNDHELHEGQWYLSDTCVICQNTRLTIDNNNGNAVGFLPCRHACLCQECYHDYQNRIIRTVPCYLCRRSITNIVRFN